MTFDKCLGLAYVCDKMHSGQWSRGYRILSRLMGVYRLDRNDSACVLLPRDEYEEARGYAAHYLRVVRSGVEF